MADANSILASLALAEVGEEPLTSLLDAGKAAQVVNLVLPQARGEIFDLPVSWKFATSRVQLDQLSTAPDFGYLYQYKLPPHCRRIIATVDENGDEIQYKYRREVYISGPNYTPVLLCNQEECRILFIANIVNPGLWPAWFSKLVVLNMAIMIAKPLTREVRMKLNLLYAWKDAYNLAKAVNDMEDIDVSDKNRNLDLGNNDVLEAASSIDPNRVNELLYPGW